MELEKSLEYLGLGEKEAKVYLALLQLGSGSVPKISTKANVKRPTTYLILEELRKKGLVTLVPKPNKTIYTAQSPRQLLEEQEEREEIIREKMPELLAMFNSQKEKPKISFYEGEENIVELYNKIFEEKEVDIFGSIGALSEEAEKQLERNIALVKKNNTRVRELLEADQKSIRFQSRINSEMIRIKIAPEQYKFPTDNLIFGNKIAIFSYKDTPQAVVIESSDVVATYKSVFEILWKSV
jgi:sugar-specific transcriptional regulator TrmB